MDFSEGPFLFISDVLPVSLKGAGSDKFRKLDHTWLAHSRHPGKRVLPSIHNSNGLSIIAASILNDSHNPFRSPGQEDLKNKKMRF